MQRKKKLIELKRKSDNDILKTIDESLKHRRQSHKKITSLNIGNSPKTA